MSKYGQAEYAYHILNQICENLLKAEIITESQFKQLDERNYDDCFRQYITALAA